MLAGPGSAVVWRSREERVLTIAPEHDERGHDGVVRTATALRAQQTAQQGDAHPATPAKKAALKEAPVTAYPHTTSARRRAYHTSPAFRLGQRQGQRYGPSMLSEDEYVRLAQKELTALINALDALEQDDLQAELENDIITIDFGGGTPFVINSHRAARQIWMAAERTAWHFDFDLVQNSWIAHKTGDELWATLTRTLRQRLGGSDDLLLSRQ